MVFKNAARSLIVTRTGPPPSAPRRTVSYPGKLVKNCCCMVATNLRRGSCYNSTPIFPFLLLTCPHKTSVPTPPTHVLLSCASRSWDLSLLILHSCALSSLPCSCLVPYGCAATSYHVPLTCSSMTHLSPFSIIHPPHLVCFLIAIYITDTLCFTPIRGPMLLFLIQYYT